MIAEVVYTETYKITLSAVTEQIEQAYGTKSAEKFLNKLDLVVKKIIKNPYIFQEVPIHVRYRRAVVTSQSSLVYEVTETKIILLYIFDNRQQPLWA